MFAAKLVVVLLAVAGRAGTDPRPVRLTVVAVFASHKHDDIHPKLEALAAEVRKREPALTGFRPAATLAKSVPAGESHTFALPDRQTLKVTVEHPRGPGGRVGLTIAPPGMGDVTYECVCDKFFPVVTPHTTKAGERLIVVVMAKPCTGGK